MKFGLTSIVLPPSYNGQAIALYNLLSGIDPGDYCLISQRYFGKKIDEGGICTQRLEAPYYHIKRFVLDIENFLVTINCKGILWPLDQYVTSISRQIVNVLTREGCTMVIGCTADLIGTHATFLAAKRMGIPFVLYAFDDYELQWIRSSQQKYASYVAPQTIRNAAAIIVPNEYLQNAYRNRYGVESVVIRNTVDFSRYGSCQGTSETEMDGREEKRIVYTGDIYEAHYDAFRNLLQAVEMASNKKIKVHIYSRRAKEELAQAGIRGPIVIHEAVPMEMIPSIQGAADLLFMPLAFSSDLPPEILKTSAPMKMGEYLASGRPVLVHAPKDSFVSWYFRANDVGIVVDSDDPEELSAAIVEILKNADIRERVTRNARLKARTDFSPAVARKQFVALLKRLDGSVSELL